MQHHAIRLKLTDVSEQNIASIFRIEEQAKQDNGMKQNCYLLHAGFFF
jgi:hypothetical protein